MTRINAFIDITTLYDKHSNAEHREMVRIPNDVKRGLVSLENQPEDFKLGTGHVIFFRDKLKFLHKRYIELYQECKNRGFNVTDMSEAFKNVPKHLYNDYTPSESEIKRVQEVLMERILERTPKDKRKTKYKSFKYHKVKYEVQN